MSVASKQNKGICFSVTCKKDLKFLQCLWKGIRFLIALILIETEAVKCTAPGQQGLLLRICVLFLAPEVTPDFSHGSDEFSCCLTQIETPSPGPVWWPGLGLCQYLTAFREGQLA